MNQAGRERHVDAFGDSVEMDEGEPVLQALSQGPVEVVVGAIPLQRINEGAVGVLGIRIDVLAAGTRPGGLDGERAAPHLVRLENARRAVGEQDLLAVVLKAVGDGAPGNVVAVDLLQQAQAGERGLPEVVAGGRAGAGAGHYRPPTEETKKEKAPAMAKASCRPLPAGDPGPASVPGPGYCSWPGPLCPGSPECSSLVQGVVSVEAAVPGRG